MATKLTLGTHAISALMLQAKRFGAMSVHFAKSADLATSQANEIAIWTSKLIDAVTRIRQEAQDAAAASREYVQDKIRTLKTQADSTKRKILDTSDLDSSRTIKANFRLIFGPPRETEHKSNSTKSVMATNLIRINTIRGLCESNPHGVIAISTTYPTKVWTESSPEVFDGLIKLVKDEKEQDWPEEIVDIMDEQERERQMSVEFRNLRGMINFTYILGVGLTSKQQRSLSVRTDAVGGWVTLMDPHGRLNHCRQCRLANWLLRLHLANIPLG
jgi:hypothetical protein